jgi:YVTN family beta-propeller protein
MKLYYRLLLWVALMPTFASAAAAGEQLYVLNRNGTMVTVVDTATNKVVGTIDGIPSPRGAAFSPDGSLAYITSGGDDTLDVVDRKTNRITKKVHLTGYPSGNLALTNDAKYLLAGLSPFLDLGVTQHQPEDSGGIDVIDTSSLNLVKKIPVKEGIHDVFMTPDGNYAIAGADLGTFAIVIDLHTLEPAWKIPFDSGVLTMAIEGRPNRPPSRIFVELKNFNGFAVVDFREHKVVTKIEFPDPTKFRFGGGFRANGSQQYNPAHGTAISPDGKSLWICSRATNYAYVYSLPELKLVGKIPMPEHTTPGHPVDGSDPHWLVFTPDGSGVYVCLAASDEVIAIDPKTMKEVAHIPAGDRPTVIEISRS